MIRTRINCIRPVITNCQFKRCLTVKQFNDNYVSVEFGNGLSSNFNTVFLRDSCTSPKSVNISSKQKTFTTSSISNSLKIAEVPHVRRNPETGENHLDIVWKENDGSLHESSYKESFLKNHSSSSVVHENTMINRKLWNNEDLSFDFNSLFSDYAEYFSSNNKSFNKVVNDLNKYGLSFIENVPDPSEETEMKQITEKNVSRWPVSKLATRFGYIKRTFYGDLFDVRNEKEAKNIANTATFLPLHMDLLYYESPPGLQLLHFIKNSTLGGENIFSDSFLAADIIRDIDITAYEALKEVPISYHYNNNDEYYYFNRPVIVEDPFDVDLATGKNKILAVNYSPPFQAPFQMSTYSQHTRRLWENFLRGLELFEEIVNDPRNQLKLKMKEGNCVIFDNRRVLHSREAFSDSNNGDRWLMGCYVDGDSFRSKMRMANKLNLSP